MNSKILLGATFAAVFAFAMMANPVFAGSSGLDYESHNDFSMTVEGNNIGTSTQGHDVIVYAFVTDKAGINGQIVYVAAVHPSFNDDPDEQTPGNKKIHAHELELDASLCVVGINQDPSLTVEKNTVTITGTDVDANAVGWVIAGYDQTGDDGGLLGGSGLCPTEVYYEDLPA